MAENYWNIPGIPHKGWGDCGVDDLGEPCFVCEMCGQEEIRYVHHLCHPEHDDISVGCVCACKMTEDYVMAKELEKNAKNRSARKARLLSKAKQQWLYSANGNQYLRNKGLAAGVFNKGQWWNYWAKDKAGKTHFGQVPTKIEHEAKVNALTKLAEFDV